MVVENHIQRPLFFEIVYGDAEKLIFMGLLYQWLNF